MKLNKILLVGTVAACALTVSSLSFLANKTIKSSFLDAGEQTLTLSLEELNTSNKILTTSEGNEVRFSVSRYNNGVFSSNGFIKNNTAISGLKSLTVSFNTLNVNLTISYGWDGLDDYLVADKVINSNSATCSFDGHYPSYFSLENKTSQNIEVESILLEYSCSETAVPDDLMIKYTRSNNFYYVESCYKKCVNAVVLSTYDNLPVKKIGEGAFAENTYLASVTIPNSVTTIDATAFNNCTSLNSVSLGNGVTSIGKQAFYCCESLSSINLPNSITTIGERCFYICTSLTSVVIPNRITTLNYGTFAYCTKLASVTIPESVTLIGSTAFTGCSSLTSITIPDSVTTIHSYAFSTCTSLTSIVIPDGITTIEGYTFTGCSSLTSITIPDSVTSIGNYALRYTALPSITIPAGVTSIGDGAFYKCSSLSSIIFEGTKAKWSSMQLGSKWNTGTKVTVVQCSDGNVTL